MRKRERRELLGRSRRREDEKMRNPAAGRRACERIKEE